MACGHCRRPRKNVACGAQEIAPVAQVPFFLTQSPAPQISTKTCPTRVPLLLPPSRRFRTVRVSPGSSVLGWGWCLSLHCAVIIGLCAELGLTQLFRCEMAAVAIDFVEEAGSSVIFSATPHTFDKTNLDFRIVFMCTKIVSVVAKFSRRTVESKH